jgi:hypothetical protein
MSIQLFNRIEQIDYLISSKSTGKPKDFAKKIGFSERALYDTIYLMKALGAPILYCKQRKTYFYSSGGRLLIGFKNVDEISENRLYANKNLAQALNIIYFFISGVTFLI